MSPGIGHLIFFKDKATRERMLQALELVSDDPYACVTFLGGRNCSMKDSDIFVTSLALYCFSAFLQIFL
jgi:hypothetical protein